jgi:dynein heavy chain 2
MVLNLPVRLRPPDLLQQVLMAPRDAQGREITWRSAAALSGYVRRLSEVSDWDVVVHALQCARPF